LFDFLALAALLLLAPLSQAPLLLAQGGDQETASESGQSSYSRGFGVYQRYCRNCHGKTAKGDGQVAAYLKIPPADLTLLAAGNEGEFPTERARAIIDGREEVRLHGRRDMPIWGDVFQMEEDQSEADMTSRVDDLIAYLQGIQVEASDQNGED
jgi:mono/diheme cytochrome c family protein